MKITSPRFLDRLAFTGLAAVLALAGCSTPAPPPLPVAVIPPAAPAPPPVTLSSTALRMAGAYRLYMRRASDISPAFADGQAVQQSLISAESYEPRQFLGGAIAYGALVALQSPQFVASVRTYAVDPNSRRDLAQRLAADPNYAAALPSAASAAGLITAALAADAARMHHTGELVKQAAYDVQHQAWSKEEVSGRDARLANAKAMSAQPIIPPEADVQMLGRAVGGADGGAAAFGVTAEPLAPPYTPVVSHALALAAIAALGEGGEVNDATLLGVMDERASAFCLSMAKLNLYQCLSVAKPYYEDVFCLGQHILLDTAQCVDKAVGVAEPVVVAQAAPAPPAPTTPAKKKTTRKAKRAATASN